MLCYGLYQLQTRLARFIVSLCLICMKAHHIPVSELAALLVDLQRELTRRGHHQRRWVLRIRRLHAERKPTSILLINLYPNLNSFTSNEKQQQ